MILRRRRRWRAGLEEATSAQSAHSISKYSATRSTRACRNVGAAGASFAGPQVEIGLAPSIRNALVVAFRRAGGGG